MFCSAGSQQTGKGLPPIMNNATENQTGHWPVRNAAAAADQQRTREMPLLFQLADATRAAAASMQASANTQAFATSLPTAIAPPAPKLHTSNLPPVVAAPIELPKADPFPLASSVLDSWPKAPSSMFEIPSGLSTAALAIGAAAHKEEAKPAASATLAPESPVAEKKPAEKLADKPATPAVSSGLPAAIESAVKAATETSEAKAEVKIEAKAEAKVETKAAAKPEVKVELKPDAKTAKPAADTTAAATPTTEKPSPASLRRQRAEARQAKVEGKKDGDWLQSHGKVIAICFVLALLGTIYLARRNRGAALPPPTIDTPNLAVEIPGEHSHDKHDHTPVKPVEAANTAPRLVEAPSHPQDTTPSPATPVEPAAPPTSTAELHSPVVPNAGQSTTPPTSEPLFPWQNESRVATRPDAVQPTAPAHAAPPTAAPSFNPPTYNAPAANTAPPSAPTLNAPTYPETNLRDAPLLPPAPPATPTTAPGSGQGGSTGRVPRSFSPASFTSAPGGNRYERTGSGLY